MFLPEQQDGVWTGYLPGCRGGQRYGYRVHGAWSPEQGLRHNPAKLLIDPWARRLDGRLPVVAGVFDYERPAADGEWRKTIRTARPSCPCASSNRRRAGTPSRGRLFRGPT